MTLTGTMPTRGRTTRPWASSSWTMGLALSIEMAKPIPCASSMMAVLIPITAPLILTSGPPEFPGLIAASVWIRSWRAAPPGSSIDRPTALTTPTVTVGPPSSPSGWPIAMTVSPTSSLPESPRVATGKLLPSILTTARSVTGSAPTSLPGNVRPSGRVTRICCAPSTTWALVST